jgi:hypothetical protein
MLGILPSTFYRWCDRYRAGGPEALEGKPSKPDRVWNRIPDDVRERIVAMALDVPELSPRELATRFTDTQCSSSRNLRSYRLLKAHDLIISPASIEQQRAPMFFAPFGESDCLDLVDRRMGEGPRGRPSPCRQSCRRD